MPWLATWRMMMQCSAAGSYDRGSAVASEWWNEYVIVRKWLEWRCKCKDQQLADVMMQVQYQKLVGWWFKYNVASDCWTDDDVMYSVMTSHWWCDSQWMALWLLLAGCNRPATEVECHRKLLSVCTNLLLLHIVQSHVQVQYATAYWLKQILYFFD